MENNFIDITAFNASELNNEFNIIIDKGCLDGIISEPKNGENKFIIALNNLLILLDDNGVIYYFSIGKLEDRVKLFDKVPKIKYKITTIGMNEQMKEEYNEYNPDNNIYYLYTITKS